MIIYHCGTNDIQHYHLLIDWHNILLIRMMTAHIINNLHNPLHGTEVGEAIYSNGM